ncbi:MAG: redoxin domain-containing protein, partial [Nitrosopumilus sp.]|nr:redoxin domain-containing protein [Nitrosopumilus sp.]
MKSEIRSALILGVVIATGIGIMSIVFSTLDKDAIVSTEGDLLLKIDKSGFKMAPDLVGIAHYLNTTPEELIKEIEDKVVLYDIWTYSCINCIRTLPYITAWDDKYSDQGLLIVGIHSPEFEFEKDPENVKMAIAKHGISYPVVLDNDMETWKAFENRYWPRKYIADHEGYIRYDHIGEGSYQETEKIIQQLLDERATSLGIQMASAASLVDIDEFEHTMFRTPELYFGYKFAQNRNQLGNDEGFQVGKTVTYSAPDNIDLHKFYLTGDWK